MAIIFVRPEIPGVVDGIPGHKHSHRDAHAVHRRHVAFDFNRRSPAAWESLPADLTG